METYFRIRKVAVCIAFVVFGLWAIDAHAINPFDELKGGEVTFKGVCRIGENLTLPCIEVTNNGKVYIIMFDKDGEAALFQKIHEKFVLLWDRRSV